MSKPAKPAIITHSLIVPEHVERARVSWAYKAIKATKGNQTRLGCMVIRIIGRAPHNPPRFSLETGMVILDEATGNKLGLNRGYCVADYQARPGKPFLATPIGHVNEITENFRGLADHLKLTDADRIAMFDCLRNWIQQDMTATSSTVVGEQGETDAATKH